MLIITKEIAIQIEEMKIQNRTRIFLQVIIINITY